MAAGLRLEITTPTGQVYSKDVDMVTLLSPGAAPRRIACSLRAAVPRLLLTAWPSLR
ncbi:MAG: hypothetical protein NT167_04190 [Verrucomicrobia bacterium]|nr:hypothetical protein [Verrucomicrobiota bacterium]